MQVWARWGENGVEQQLAPLGSARLKTAKQRQEWPQHVVAFSSEAAALAGAAYFFDGTNATPNWTLASQKAQTAITRNTAAGAALTTGTVATGYWNLVDTPKVLQALPMEFAMEAQSLVAISLEGSVG